MKLLFDANCWMEVARSRPQAAVVRQLLSAVPPSDVAVTDFALHAVGLAMLRHKTLDAYPTFVGQMGIGTTIEVLTIAPADLVRVVNAVKAHNLDFDDAYQYAAAELHGLALVSLDADFDRTPRGRLTPAAALARYAGGSP